MGNECNNCQKAETNELKARTIAANTEEDQARTHGNLKMYINCKL